MTAFKTIILGSLKKKIKIYKYNLRSLASIPLVKADLVHLLDCSSTRTTAKCVSQFSTVIQSFASSLARNIIIFLFSSYFCLGRPNVLTMSFLSLRLFLLLFLLDLAMILSMPIPSRIPHSINKILFHFAGYKIK